MPARDEQQGRDRPSVGSPPCRRGWVAGPVPPERAAERSPGPAAAAPRSTPGGGRPPGNGERSPMTGRANPHGTEIYDGRPGREPPLFGRACDPESGTAPGEKPAQGTRPAGPVRESEKSPRPRKLGTRESPPTGDGEPAGAWERGPGPPPDQRIGRQTEATGEREREQRQDERTERGCQPGLAERRKSTVPEVGRVRIPRASDRAITRIRLKIMRKREELEF